MPFALFDSPDPRKWTLRLVAFLIALLPALQPGPPAAPPPQASTTSVEILRDRWGVPHLFGTAEGEGFFGLGYATAEDRMIQMELLRRRARGRLAEVYGERLLESDRRFHIAGIPRHCDEAAAGLPADLRSWFEYYAAGVNAYRKDNPADTARRFAALGVAPESWTPGDCVCAWLGVAEVFDRLYDAGPVQTYRDFEAAVAAGGEDEASRQRSLVIDDPAAIVPEKEMARDPEAYARLKALRPIAGGWAFSYADEVLRFSHAWAVDGTRSVTGKPILESDPQTAVSNPPLWYEFHIAAGRFDVRGIGVAGMPAMLIGFNRSIAWGVTALGASSTLTYLERRSPDGQGVLFRGAAEPLERRIETILVRDGAPVNVEVSRSRHGYVFDALALGTRADEALVTHNPQVEERNTSLTGLLRMMAARDWPEFRQAMAGYYSPGLHLVYADAGGNIGYQTLLHLRRTRRSPRIALEGWSGLDEPQGRIDLDELPHMLAPESHFVSHANNLPVGSWYPYDLGIGTGGIGHTTRSLRLVQLLSAGRLFSLQSFESDVHRDDVNAAVAALLPVARRVAAETPNLSPSVRVLLDRMRDWDSRYRARAPEYSAAFSLAASMLTPYRRSRLATRLGGGEGGITHLARLLADQYGSSMGTPQDADVRAYLLSWLAAAGDHYEQNGAQRESVDGRSREIWNMPYQANGPLGLPSLDSALDLRSTPLECAQGGTIWSQTGNSYTQIVDLADIDQSRSVLPPGINEDASSRFHTDQLDIWAAGTTRAAPLSRSTLEPLAVSRRALPVPELQQPAGQYGPWNRDLLYHVSRDGLHFEARGTFVERGGVPSLVRAGDGRLFAAFQWFPLDRQDAFDRIALRISNDQGETWSAPRPVEIGGMPATLYRAFDPTLVTLPDGGLRLYFSSERGSQESNRGNRAIFSAVSVDGFTYSFEPGQRFGFPDAETFDPAVAWFRSGWHLYCPIPGRPGRGYYAVSKDGLDFGRRRDVTIQGERDWLGNAVAHGDVLRFYGSGREGSWAAASFDGFIWALGEARSGLGGDPAVALNLSGLFLAVSTGPLRPDAKLGPPPF